MWRPGVGSPRPCGGDEARADIDDLSQKYTNGPYANPIQHRAGSSCKIDVDKVHKMGL